MEEPVIPMDTGLFKSNGDVKVVDAVVESHKVAMVKDGSKLMYINSTFLLLEVVFVL